MTREPLVSVLMPVHNGERYLKQAVDSILNQTFADFEFIIVNDASTDETLDTLRSFTDRRILKIDNEVKMGIAESLNRGLELCRGKYIARMDSDDVADPNRLALQVDFLESHPDVCVLGTGINIINEKGVVIGVENYHADPFITAWRMAWSCSVAHPSVMINKAALLQVGGYDPGLRYAEDYDLWIRLLQVGGKITVFPKPLLHYRMGKSQETFVFSDRFKLNSTEISNRHISWLLGEAIDRQLIEQTIGLMKTEKVYGIQKVLSSVSLIDRMRKRFVDRLGGGIGSLTGHVSDSFESNAKIAFTGGAWAQSMICLLYSLYLCPRKIIRPAIYGSMLSGVLRTSQAIGRRH